MSAQEDPSKGLRVQLGDVTFCSLYFLFQGTVNLLTVSRRNLATHPEVQACALLSSENLFHRGPYLQLTRRA